MMYAEDRSEFERQTLSVSERVQACLARINEHAHLNAYLHVCAESALLQAAESDERFRNGTARVLEGLIVAVKDNISMKGAPLTCASRILEGFQPVYDATVIVRLRDAGAIVIGKTNMDEFAMGSSNENSAYGAVLHPIDATRVPGGSSGGSAVAVATGTCHVALGSDTGGSVRQPAAFCGVYGYKPTYGAISRYGLVAFASSLDQIGIFANTTQDILSVLAVIGGYDPLDSTSSTSFSVAGDDIKVNGSRDSNSFHPLRIGRISGSLLEGCSQAIRSAYESFMQTLEKQGAEVSNIELPASEIWIPTYFILATAEASSNLARYDGVRYGMRSANEDSETDMITATRSSGFGTEVKRRIMLGTYVLSSGYHDAYYTNAQRARRIIAEGYERIFDHVHLVCLPTTPTTAFVRGEITDPVQMWLSDLFTVSANIAGIPAISIPWGTDEQGLPIGVQLQGRMFGDQDLLVHAGSTIKTMVG